MVSQARFTNPALLKKLEQCQASMPMSFTSAESASQPVRPSVMPAFALASASQGNYADTARYPQMVHFSAAGTEDNTGVSWNIQGRHAFEANSQYRYFERSRVIVKLVPW
ncbi:MAG: hypothetical protein SFV17_21240 [Candidatus Obscuribacter sp.]|nr:hypothetical protein [Candidatus Obscuribacter sp.]